MRILPALIQDKFTPFRMEKRSRPLRGAVLYLWQDRHFVRGAVTAPNPPTPIRVLYADDDSIERRVARRQLDAQGFAVVEAEDGEQALRLAGAERFDVVVLDYRMPRRDGLEVLQAMRAGPGPVPPVVMISAMGNLEVAVRAVRLGASDYLVKDMSGAYIDLLPTTLTRVVERQRMIEERERANAAKSRLLAALAHDLHQPLVALRLQLEDFETQVATPAHRQRVGGMLELVKTGESMLQQITEQAALETGRITPRVEPVDVAALVREVDREFAGIADAKALTLRTWIDGRRPSLRIETDPSLLMRMLGNLVSNAIRYTDRGGVLIGLRRGGSRWRIDVWDTGIGIPDQELDKIFDEYYRGQGNSARGGFGLGLATTRQIATLLGLQVNVRSRPGRGSLFSISGPCCPTGKAATRPSGLLSLLARHHTS